MHRECCHALFYHSNNIWSRKRIMNILIMRSPVNFSRLVPNCLRKKPFLERPHRMFVRQGET
jgi:hypothetical protein